MLRSYVGKSVLFACAIASLAALGGACAGALRTGASHCPPTCPNGSAPALANAAGMPGADAPASVAAEPGGFDPNGVKMVLDDPRLAAVREAADREAYAQATQALAAALVAIPPPSPEDARAWLFQLGRLRALANDAAGAADAYEKAAQSAWALSDVAAFDAAEQLLKAGQYEAALARAKGVTPANLPVARDLELVIADALAGKGDIAAAAPYYRTYLGVREAHAAQPMTLDTGEFRTFPTIAVALRFARALLAHPSVEHAEEAAVLARKVRFEAMGGAGSDDAKQIERDALATLPVARRKRFENPTPEELAARAKNLLAAQQTKEALRVTDALVKTAMMAKPGEAACDGWIARGEALAKLKKKPEAADAYGDAIARCAGSPRQPEALFAGARTSYQANRSAEALARYAELEKQYPTHRLADDARLRGAKIALEMGDEARFAKMLSSMPDDYPNGDVVTDGLVELALARVEKRDFAGAIAPLERALARAPHEHAYFASGRLPYFLGRVKLEAGRDDGIELLKTTIRDYPLSFYMTLAFARVADRDRAGAEATLRDAIAREPAGPFVIARSPAFEQPPFVRAVELARQGESRLARAELDKLGVGARTAPRELLWAAAFLLARAGAPGLAHGILRSATGANAAERVELTEWLDHYPVGRWRAAWELAYPRPFADVVEKETKKNAIPEALAYAIMREESAFDPRVVSWAGAIGLMQLMSGTAKIVAKPLGVSVDDEALKTPNVNVALGCRYLASLRSQFPDATPLAIPSYNAGVNAPKKWLSERAGDFDLWVERIPYEETRNYTKRVLASMAAYEFLYARDRSSETLHLPLATGPGGRTTVAASQP